MGGAQSAGSLIIGSTQTAGWIGHPLWSARTGRDTTDDLTASACSKMAHGEAGEMERLAAMFLSSLKRMKRKENTKAIKRKNNN